MKLNHVTFLILIFSAVFSGCGDKKQTELGQETKGEFAPADAYLNGAEHPYYGSENEWDQRFFYEHADNYYKRRGQRAMLELVKGNPESAEEYCRKLLEIDPNDREALFNLSAALANQNKIDEALKVVEISVEKGLPFERYEAGPKDILSPLTNSEGFKELAEKKGSSLLHGPMVGKVTAHGAGFWVRTAGERDVQIRVSHSSSMSKAIYSDMIRSKKENDFTAVLSLDGLEPDTYYFYEVLVDGKLPQRVIHSFSTFPSKGEPAKYSIIFGGGAGYVPQNEKMWTTIKLHHPLAFLWMGDNVYIDLPENPNGLHYYTYYRRQSRPEFRNLVSSTANYAIWDDHDAATDDVWLGPYKTKPFWKLPLLEVFEQNWINPSAGSDKWPACYFSFSMGDIDVFMLDGRFYRTNPFDVNPTMLGPEQKQWLLNSLKNSTAVFKVIASPVPWSYAAKKDAKDTWNGFRNERDEIFDFLSENKIDGVILLSADRHRSDAWKIKREKGYPLYEFTSSRLTNQHSHPLIDSALFGYNAEPSFGKITFDTRIQDPTVTYEIHNIDNELIDSITLKKSQLTSPE